MFQRWGGTDCHSFIFNHMTFVSPMLTHFLQVPETRACSRRCTPRWPNSFPGSQWNGGGKQYLKANCTWHLYQYKSENDTAVSHFVLWIPCQNVAPSDGNVAVVSVQDLRPRPKNDPPWSQFCPVQRGAPPQRRQQGSSHFPFPAHLLDRLLCK